MILVLGDRIIDHYTFCEATRLCPEAPAPVLVPKSERTSGGGAQLVYEQLQALTGMKNEAFYGSMSHKHRIFAGHFLQCRIDRDRQSILNSDVYWRQILAAMNTNIFRAVIVSDYGKGAMTQELAKGLVQVCLRKETPLFVDAKAGAEAYKGCFALFPNHKECLTAAPIEYTHIIRKLGSRGCQVDGRMVPTTEQQVFDETGAGDVFIAAFVSKFLSTQNLIECAEFANSVAGESVKHLGTYIVQPNQINNERSKDEEIPHLSSPRVSNSTLC